MRPYNEHCANCNASLSIFANERPEKCPTCGRPLTVVKYSHCASCACKLPQGSVLCESCSAALPHKGSE